MISRPKKNSRCFLAVLLTAILLIFWRCDALRPQVVYYGSFHANDSGESHGGFAWAAGYSATLEIRGTQGKLFISFETGLGDYLEEYTYSVSRFTEVGGQMNFRIKGRDVNLVFIEKDAIWNGEYDHHYIGNNSIIAEESIGSLPVDIFPGFGSHFYVELRFLPSANSQNFFRAY